MEPLARALIVAAALAVAPPVLAAPEAVLQEAVLPEAAQEAPDAERARPMLLHLADGRVLRARARLDGDAWVVEQRAGDARIPAAFVARSVAERDALAELDERKRAAKAEGSYAERARVGAWALDEGLLEEGRRELDDVLEEWPDEPTALAALWEGRPVARVPLPDTAPLEGEPLTAALLTALRTAGSGTPSTRELAARQLGELGLDEELLAAARAGLRTRDARTRAGSALVMRRHYPGVDAAPLAYRSLLDRDEAVRRESALALAASDDRGALGILVQGLGSESTQIQYHAATALGYAGQPAAVAPLANALFHVTAAPGGGYDSASRGHVFFGKQQAYVQDFDVEVANFVSIADPVINVLAEGTVLDVTVLAVTMSSAKRRGAIRSSIARLTGHDPGSNRTAWTKWWETSPHNPDAPTAAATGS